MPRTVKEWIGKTDDTPVPRRVQLRVFERFDGRCGGCGQSLRGRRKTCDHKLAIINGGENRETNLQPLGDLCCNPDKNKADVAIKALTYRKRAAHAGIRKRQSRPMPGTYASGIKIPFNGPPIRRRTGEPVGMHR